MKLYVALGLSILFLSASFLQSPTVVHGDGRAAVL